MTKNEFQRHLLDATNLVQPKHHPDSLSGVYPTYRSVLSPAMTDLHQKIITSGSFDGLVFYNARYPNSPYVTIQPRSFELRVPASGVASGCQVCCEPLDCLACFSGWQSGWHCCGESFHKLMNRVLSSDLVLSGILI